jgi:hypothetical protein
LKFDYTKYWMFLKFKVLRMSHDNN